MRSTVQVAKLTQSAAPGDRYVRDDDQTDPVSDNGKEHGFATSGNSDKSGQPPMNIIFSSHCNCALGVQPAPVFFKASTIRNSSELCRLSSSEILVRLRREQHKKPVR